MVGPEHQLLLVLFLLLACTLLLGAHLVCCTDDFRLLLKCTRHTMPRFPLARVFPAYSHGMRAPSLLLLPHLCSDALERYDSFRHQSK